MGRFLNNNERENADKESSSSTSGMTVKERKCRKYDDGYLEHGVTSTESRSEKRPLYVLCMNVLTPAYALNYIETPFRN